MNLSKNDRPTLNMPRIDGEVILTNLIVLCGYVLGELELKAQRYYHTRTYYYPEMHV